VLAACAVLISASSRGAESSLLADTDMPGFDYRHFDLPRSSPRLCEESCLSDAACRAWTYVKPAVFRVHATCWLKDRVPDSHTDPCCVSCLR